MKKQQIGILLVNVGTPKSPHKSDVAAYLNEFLTDPNVIPLPWPLRHLLVRGFIVPRRAGSSSEKYKKVWTPEGSPLLVNSLNFANSLQKNLGEGFLVKVAMRYGEPAITSQVQKLVDQQVQKIIVVPMFPQEAKATSGTVVSYVKTLQIPETIKVEYLPAFYHRQEFIDAWAPLMKEAQFDHLLMSFHGLPVKQNCDLKKCKVTCVGSCYKSQCENTARSMAQMMGLNDTQWTLSFQSRLGAGEWLRPYTDEKILELKHQGVKRLAVVSPAFVADCLETLEELGLECKEKFEADNPQGQFQLIPSLNDHPEWVHQFTKLIRE